MSRFSDEWDDLGGLAWLQMKACENALRSKRGKAALAELREALLALPEPKLCSSYLAVDGQVCAIGAYVAKKQADARGEPISRAITRLSAATKRRITDYRKRHGYTPEPWDIGEDGERTARIGEKHGLTFSLAWSVAGENDEGYARTDAERFQMMLRWIDKELARPPLTRPRKTA